MYKSKKLPPIVKKIRENKFPEINFGYQKNISYSQLSLFNTCPHKWALQYRDGKGVKEQSIHMVFGTALHSIIQKYLNKIYEVSGAEADRMDLIKEFEEILGNEYLTCYKKNKNVHFSNSSELREFYEEGVEILNYLKKKRSLYFGNKGWYLIGCEIPIQFTPNPNYKNCIFNGYLDTVLYHEPTNKFKIIDYKTSKSGWNESTKKDELKQFQLILYKHFLSKIYNIPIENIDIEFFIVKRKLYENCDFVQKRIQIFTPPSGKVKINKATKLLDEFITTCFNTDGSYKKGEYEPIPSLFNCSFCNFKENKSLCSKGIS